MKHITYSAVTKNYYFIPKNGAAFKINITDDIKEILLFELKKLFRSGCLRCGSPDILSEHLRICRECHIIEFGITPVDEK